MRVSISSLGGHLKTGQRALPRTRTSPTFPSVWGLDQKMRLGCHQINDQTGGRPLALPKTTEMAWKVATLRVCLGIPGFDRMRSRRRIEENPGCFSNRGLSLAAPINGAPTSKSHPGMIGAGCPVLPRESSADGVTNPILLPQVIKQRKVLLELFDLLAHDYYSPRKRFPRRPRRPQI